MSVTVLSGTQLLPGASLEVSVDATDDLGLADMSFTLSGAASDAGETHASVGEPPTAFMITPTGTSTTRRSCFRSIDPISWVFSRAL